MRFDEQVTGAGIVIILLCGFFFGLYAVSVRYFLGGINSMVSFGVVCQFVSIGTFVAMLCFGEYSQLREISGQNWGLLVISAILGIALGHHFLYSAVTRLGAAVTSGAQTLAPFLTILLAATFLGESHVDRRMVRRHHDGHRSRTAAGCAESTGRPQPCRGQQAVGRAKLACGRVWHTQQLRPLHRFVDPRDIDGVEAVFADGDGRLAV